MQAIADDFDAIKDELGRSAALDEGLWINDRMQTGPLDQTQNREKAFEWLAERVNTFVNVLRPRMRSAAADYQSRGE